MKYCRLGNTDLKVSSLGMGCVTFGREIDADTSHQILDYAFERGINLYDTAEAYASGESEKVLGYWIASRGIRDRIVLGTKVASPLTAERIFKSVDESLARLKTDRIDLFQLHCWDASVPLEVTLAALTKLIDAEKIRYIGCSNWSAWQLAKALLLAKNQELARMESVQPPYNLVQREIEQDLLPLCVDQQVGVIAYSPLGAGFLTGKYRKGGEVPKGTRFDVMPGHQPIYFTGNGYRIMEGLRVVADEIGQSMIQLALAWVTHRPDVSSVLIGARITAHVDQALKAEQADLPNEIMQRLEEL